MLTRLEIENFRAFSRMKLEGLSRVNLLVGKNGCGKSTVLEALSVLAGNGAPMRVLLAMTQRDGDWIQDGDERFRRSRDVTQLFHGADQEGDAHAVLKGDLRPSGRVDLRLVTASTDALRAGSLEGRPLLWRPAPESPAFASRRRVLLCEGAPDLPLVALELVKNRVSAEQFIDDEANNRPRTGCGILPCSGIQDRIQGQAYSMIVATEAEDRVAEVLRILRPDLERLVWIPPGGDALPAGFYAKLSGSKERLPLSRFGEGLRRLLGIALELCRGGMDLLLIDEIDTGLHHSVLEQLWRALVLLARELNVQIFATTHSGDCVRSLAWLVEDQPELGPEVSLHRLDPAMDTSVRYGADELALAARHHVEVRG